MANQVIQLTSEQRKELQEQWLFQVKTVNGFYLNNLYQVINFAKQFNIPVVLNDYEKKNESERICYIIEKYGIDNDYVQTEIEFANKLLGLNLVFN